MAELIDGSGNAPVSTLAQTVSPALAEAVQALLAGRLGNPFALLGPHREGDAVVVRSFQPGARKVEVLNADGEPLAALPMVQMGQNRQPGASGLFAGPVAGLKPGQRYLLRIFWSDAGASEPVQTTEDPYAFDLLLSDFDLHLLAQGKHLELGRCLGAQPMMLGGIDGTRFALWAPNARRVSVVGDFNCWDGRRHPMRLRHGAGIWELFIPRLEAGSRYKYEIVGASGELLPHKADPVARATEAPPATASIVASAAPFAWTDQAWMDTRGQRQGEHAPISIYELHAASWLRILEEGGRSLSWDELSERLIPYALGLGFTHIELLPVMEHPFGGSWGYQPLSQFAPSARFGSPPAFARFVDACHAAGLGVILDWVPAHFPTDPHGLAQFDGTALYEHLDPREGFHQDWNTLIFNLGRNEVCGFLIASALEWLQQFHVDGLRVDAVASMLYRDYSRKPGEWTPNIHGGRENLEAVAFLRNLNQIVAEYCPGAIMIAEESTAWPGVTAPVDQGGLGFSYKWNMGWMHDTLRYAALDPLFRRYHHHDLTFGLLYAFSERFILPISHDEVVHGKGSLLTRMPGDAWQKLANLRAYLGFMWTHPGKKLLFMGCEFGQPAEWNHDQSPHWDLLDDPRHRGIQRLVRDLNRVYSEQPALHVLDCQPHGFSWVIGSDIDNSVLAYLRHADDASGAPPVLVVCNLTPVPRHAYRVGIPAQQQTASVWQELLNSDAAAYGGSNLGNGGQVSAEPVASHGQPASLVLTLPPLATLILRQGN
ncbi:1,4-alpha-glucan branching protein GlgB [Undibacterium arcticum]|uniref:1,4-alpha-glucan branching enzyme GlgB n=1 Tax=Undibacterium arcticum TaxID=1762892 RepID=A0ABV7F5A9_9BURK